MANYDLSQPKSTSRFKVGAMGAALAVLFFLLTGSVAALAYTYYQQKVNLCIGKSDICYTVVEDTAQQRKVKIENLDPTKKYRMIIKRKIDSTNTVEAGSIVLDMPNLKVSSSTVYTSPLHGIMCTNNSECDDPKLNMVCKPSGRYGTAEQYCCQPTECAAVAPYPLSSQCLAGFQPSCHCVGNGITEQVMTTPSLPPKTVTCTNGIYN